VLVRGLVARIGSEPIAHAQELRAGSSHVLYVLAWPGLARCGGKLQRIAEPMKDVFAGQTLCCVPGRPVKLVDTRVWLLGIPRISRDRFATRHDHLTHTLRTAIRERGRLTLPGYRLRHIGFARGFSWSSGRPQCVSGAGSPFVAWISAVGRCFTAWPSHSSHARRLLARGCLQLLSYQGANCHARVWSETQHGSRAPALSDDLAGRLVQLFTPLARGLPRA